MHWNPIATAPQDGTWILACGEGGADDWAALPVTVRFQSYHPNAKGQVCWRDIHGHKLTYLRWWMPIPPGIYGKNAMKL